MNINDVHLEFYQKSMSVPLRGLELYCNLSSIGLLKSGNLKYKISMKLAYFL